MKISKTNGYFVIRLVSIFAVTFVVRIRRMWHASKVKHGWSRLISTRLCAVRLMASNRSWVIGCHQVNLVTNSIVVFQDAWPVRECLDNLMTFSFSGRIMYVIPFSMGPVGGPLSKIGIQLTDANYVVLCMRIMTRLTPAVWDALGDKDFVRCIHSVGLPRPVRRIVSCYNYPEIEYE
jgi:hypothetical protein